MYIKADFGDMSQGENKMWNEPSIHLFARIYKLAFAGPTNSNLLDLPTLLLGFFQALEIHT